MKRTVLTGIILLVIGYIIVPSQVFAAELSPVLLLPDAIHGENDRSELGLTRVTAILDEHSNAEDAETDVLPFFLPKPVDQDYSPMALPITPNQVKGLSSYFSARHLGLDIRAEVGTPIFAISEGTVVEIAYESGGYGRYVIIRHVIAGVEVHSLYAHMKSTTLSIGESVKAGDRVGSVGMTGRTTGPHLHFETRACSSTHEYFRCLPMDPIRTLSQKIPKIIAKSDK